PLQFTRFFGREEEIARLVHLLTSSPLHLLTLTGPGGTGKTRLAIEAAIRLSEAFPGGIWFVPLAGLTDPRLMPGAIVDALSLPGSPTLEPLDQIVEFLNGLRVQGSGFGVQARTPNPELRTPSLLVLDNLEHLLADKRCKSEDGAAVV